MKPYIQLVLLALLPFVAYYLLLAIGERRKWWTVRGFFGAFGQAGAVVALSSEMITDLDEAGVDLVPAYRTHGRLREMAESFSVANGDSIGSTYRVFRVWSGWRVSALILDTPDIGTTGIADFGLYKTAADGGAVVDADFFASAQSLSGGALANTDITRENAVITPANADKRIWEQLGLTADPLIWYDVVATLTAASDAAGEAGLRLRYVDGT